MGTLCKGKLFHSHGIDFCAESEYPVERVSNPKSNFDPKMIFICTTVFRKVISTPCRGLLSSA